MALSLLHRHSLPKLVAIPKILGTLYQPITQDCTLLGWPFQSNSTLLVQGYGYWIGVAGLILTVCGFVFTFLQIAKTKRVALLLTEEVARVRLNVVKYDASHEASKAESALNYAKTHLQNKEWLNVASNYEDFLSYLHAMKELNIPDVNRFDGQIMTAHQYGVRLCERIGSAGSDGLSEQESVKINSTIRNHAQLIASIRIALQRNVFS